MIVGQSVLTWNTLGHQLLVELVLKCGDSLGLSLLCLSLRQLILRVFYELVLSFVVVILAARLLTRCIDVGHLRLILRELANLVWIMDTERLERLR